MNELESLKVVSKELGVNPDLVQGAGGNTSIKIDNTLWVKASGKCLAKAVDEDIFVKVNLEKLKEDFTNNSLQKITEYVLGENTLRPSIETTFHAMLNKRVVLHVHSINILTIAVKKNGKEEAKNLLGSLNFAWVPYVKPGETLTSEILKNISEETDIIILENHGLIVLGETVDEAYNRLKLVEQKCFQQKRASNQINENTELENFRNPKYKITNSLAFDPLSYELCSLGNFYPDQSVFLGPEILMVANFNEANIKIDEYKEKWQDSPKVIVVKDKCVLVGDDLSEGGEQVLYCHANLMLGLKSASNVNTLSEEQVMELLDWDAEKYRQNLK